MSCQYCGGESCGGSGGGPGMCGKRRMDSDDRQMPEERAPARILQDEHSSADAGDVKSRR